jgi:hypothetical protein
MKLQYEKSQINLSIAACSIHSSVCQFVCLFMELLCFAYLYVACKEANFDRVNVNGLNAVFTPIRCSTDPDTNCHQLSFNNIHRKGNDIKKELKFKKYIKKIYQKCYLKASLRMILIKVHYNPYYAFNGSNCSLFDVLEKYHPESLKVGFGGN